MGKSKRIEFSKQQKAEIERRASADGVRRCENCCAALKPGAGEIDHKNPEWMQSATLRRDRRPLTVEDGWLLCERCHREKTAKEAATRAHVDRVAKRHAGKHKAASPFKAWKNFKGQIIWAKKSNRGRRSEDTS